MCDVNANDLNKLRYFIFGKQIKFYILAGSPNTLDLYDASTEIIFICFLFAWNVKCTIRVRSLDSGARLESLICSTYNTVEV